MVAPLLLQVIEGVVIDIGVLIADMVTAGTVLPFPAPLGTTSLVLGNV